MADGNITIKVLLDTKEAQTTAKQLQDDLSKMFNKSQTIKTGGGGGKRGNKKVKDDTASEGAEIAEASYRTLGDVIKRVFGQADKEAEQLNKTVENVNAEKFRDEFNRVKADLDATNSKIVDIKAQMEKVPTFSNDYASLSAQLKQAEAEAEATARALAEIEDSGTQSTTQTTSEIDSLKQHIAELTAQTQAYRDKYSQVLNSVRSEVAQTVKDEEAKFNELVQRREEILSKMPSLRGKKGRAEKSELKEELKELDAQITQTAQNITQFQELLNNPRDIEALARSLEGTSTVLNNLSQNIDKTTADIQASTEKLGRLEAIERMKERFQQLGQTISNTKLSIPDIVGDKAEKATQFLVDLITNFRGTFGNITQIVKDSVTIIKGTISDIPTVLSNTWESVKSGATQAWETVKNGAQTAFNNVKQFATDPQFRSQVWQDIKTNATNALQQLPSLVGNVARGIATLPVTVFQQVGNFAKNIPSMLAKIPAKVEKIKVGFQKLTKPIRSAGRGISNLKDSAKKSFSKIGDFLKKGLKNFMRYGLGIRSTYMLFRKLRTWIIDGYKNLANSSAEVNQSVSDVMSAFSTLKNSLATMIQPIVSVVAPVLTMLIQKLTAVVNSISQVIAAFTGQSTVYKAAEVQESFAESLDKTADSAKKAQQNLSGLDEINTYNSGDKSGGGSGGGGSGRSGGTFEEVPVEDKWVELADKIKEAFANIFKPFKEAWDSTGQKVIDSIKLAFNGIITLLGSVFTAFNNVWTNGSGTKFLENILNFITNIINRIGIITQKVGDVLNKTGLLEHIFQVIFDWVNTIMEGANDLDAQFNEFIEGLDLEPLAEGIDNIVTAIDETVKPVLSDVKEALDEIFKNVVFPVMKWVIEKALPKVTEIIVKVIEKIKQIYDYVKQKIVPIIQKVVKAVGKWIDGFKKLGEKIGEAFNKLDLEGSIDQGIFSVIDLFMSLGELAVGVFDSIGESFNRWMETDGEEIGKFFESIGKIVKDVIDFVSMLFKDIGNIISEWWNGGGAKAIQDIMDVIFGIGTTIMKVWNDWVMPVWNALVEVVTDLWNTTIKPYVKKLLDLFNKIANGIKEIWEKALKPAIDWVINFVKPIIEGIINFLKPILHTIFEGITGYINGIIDAIGGIIDFVVGVFTGDWERAWTGIKEIFGGIINAVGNIFITVINAIIDVINWFLDKIWGVIDGVVKVASDIAGAIGDVFGGDWRFYKGSNKPPKISHLKLLGVNYGSGKRGGGSGGGGSSADSSVAALANGAVIPPNREFLAILGDQKSGNNIETPEKLLRQIMREELRNRANGGNYTFTANINRRTLFEEVIAEAKIRQTIDGNNPFELA